MVSAEPNPGWRAMASHGFADLSPPEAEHAMLELPTNRANYVGVLQDLGDYPSRSPIGVRVPSVAEVAALKRGGGTWRAVMLMDDERTARLAAYLFDRVFVLDPFYDSGAMLYAAWHDPYIKDEHARRLAEQAGWLVRLAPLLNAGTAVLAPDHLPGSWNPRPGWRKPRGNADRRQVAAWAMRTGLVLLYWADRLDGVVFTTRAEVIAALSVVLGDRTRSSAIELAEPPSADDGQRFREAHFDELVEMWATLRQASRRRPRGCEEDLGYSLGGVDADIRRTEWRLTLGQASVPEPAMLIRRVLNGQDPEREPALPRRRLRRRPLVLLGTGA